MHSGRFARLVITAGDPQTSPRQGDYTTSTNMCMVAQVQ